MITIKTNKENKMTPEIKKAFTYQTPNEDQIVKYKRIREKALEFSEVIVENTPIGVDQSAAIRKLRECVMTANASIALEIDEL